ncbi:putative cytochrome P450 [Septoria linicola]|nr:putative cytochrome P450 [Septoria linicola]
MSSIANPIAIAVLSVVVSAILHALYKSLNTPLRRIPGPPLATYTNIWLAWKTASGRSHTFWTELHSRYGSFVRVGPDRVTFSDPSLLSTVYGAGSHYLNTLESNLFSSQDASYHRKMKSAVAPAYSLSSMKQLEPIVDKCTSLFMAKIEEVSKEGTVELDQWLHFYGFDVVGLITFSKSFDMLESGKDHFGLDTLFNGIIYGSIIGLVPGLYRWLLGDDRLLRFLSSSKAFRDQNTALKVRNTVYQAMQEYSEKSDEARGDYITYLYNFQARNPSQMLDVDIVDSLMINIFVGSDTTAFSLTACFYHLVKHPKVYAKLRAEIDEAEAAGRLSERVSFSEGNNMPYLRATLKETLRLFPAVMMPLERVVPPGGLLVSVPAQDEKDHKPVHLPAGTRIGAVPPVLDTLTEVFGSDALSYRPERWLEASDEQLAQMVRVFFTFGGGSRICIGRHTSTMDLTKVVPEMLRRFDLEWAGRPTEEWKVQGFWFAKPSGLQLRIWNAFVAIRALSTSLGISLTQSILNNKITYQLSRVS